MPTLNKISLPFPVHILVLADNDGLNSIENVDNNTSPAQGHIVLNSQKLLLGLNE